MRFSVAMPEELLARFDELVAKRGVAKNRSEVIRDLVRDALIEEECATPGQEVMGTLTIVFDHHAGDVRENLDTIQHEFFGQIVASMHVHLDARACMEVIILRGESSAIQAVSNKIMGTKGVTHGNLTMTAVEPCAPHTHDHAHGHGHAHPHTH